MPSNKRIKIFLKKNNDVLNFMWADTSKDGSVMLGIYGSSFKTSVEKIFAREGEMVPGEHFRNIDEDKSVTNTKISFHQSGYYKLVNKIENGSIDRTTVKGLPLNEISNPTRMVEILLPSLLEKSKSHPREGIDSIIDITEFPNKPLRCTVTCMGIDKINHFNSGKIVDTSIVESSCSFEFEGMAWAWTLRVSKDDIEVHSTKFFIFMPGDIVWPK